MDVLSFGCKHERLIKILKSSEEGLNNQRAPVFWRGQRQMIRAMRNKSPFPRNSE